MVVSDDHGRDTFEQAYADAVKRYGTVDALFHAGDTGRYDNEYYTSICGCQAYIVKGNNDFNANPQELTVDVGGKKIFLTHGHRYGVYTGVERLYFAGLERNADIIIYGHTHIPLHQSGDKLEIINPGSVAGIRSNTKSYAIIDIQGDITKTTFHYL